MDSDENSFIGRNIPVSVLSFKIIGIGSIDDDGSVAILERN